MDLNWGARAPRAVFRAWEKTRCAPKSNGSGLESERDAHGHAIPVEVPERKVRFFLQELVGQLRPPKLVNLPSQLQPRHVVGVMLLKGAPEFLVEVDRPAGGH